MRSEEDDTITSVLTVVNKTLIKITFLKVKTKITDKITSIKIVKLREDCSENQTRKRIQTLSLA